MKRIFLIVLVLMMLWVIPAFPIQVQEVDTTITLTLSQDEKDLLEINMVSISEWVKNAVEVKITDLTNRLYDENKTDIEPTAIDKATYIKSLSLPKAKDIVIP
jgi:hypothetical protein